MSTFTNLLGFVRSYDEGSIITRKEIMKRVNGLHVTLDQYRLHFTRAGYLNHVGRGKYELVRRPSLNLYARELRRQAYPWWREWEEYRHLKPQNNDN